MRLRQLFESNNKSIAFCFGRMNPPTIGHEQVFKTLDNVSDDYKIFLTMTQDKKENPLSWEEKVKFVKAIHSSYANKVSTEPGLNTIGKVCSHLYDLGYRNITFVAGDDRLPQFKNIIDSYNGVEGKAHGFYKFDTINYQSSGARDPDSLGVEGISASKARERAVNGDLEGFREATGAGKYAEELYNSVRSGLKIKEDQSAAIAHTAKDLANPDTAKIMKHRARRDQEREKTYQAAQKKRDDSSKDEWGDYKNEEAAGVGIITKQNTTKDVNKGTLRKMMKGYRLI